MKRLFRAFPHWALALLAALAGAIAALGQAPWSLPMLALLAYGGVFILFGRATNWGQAAWLGWLFGSAHFGVALFWIVEPFLVDIPRHGWMAPFALFFLAGGLALLWALPFGLAARFWQGWKSRTALVILWTAAEMLRAVLFTGFPWASIGHIWVGTVLMPLASFGGAAVLTFVTLGFAAYIGQFQPRASASWGRRVRFLAETAAIIAVVIYLPGIYAPSTTFTDKTVRLVQVNAPQHLKWDAEQIPVFFGRHLDLSRDGPGGAGPKPDAILWSETAIPYRLDRAEQALEYMADAAGGTPLIFGANDLVGDTYRNTLAVMGTDGTVVEKYHKHHLVPFGEYIPFGDLFAQVGIRGLAAREGGGFGPGPGPRLIDMPGLGTALPLICYELIFPRNLRGLPRPDMIVQITNDAWFGNISGPYQHLAQARLRAVENGLPVIRVANTGVSAVIGPKGEITAQTELNKIAVLDAQVPTALAPTFYARFGDIPLLLLLTTAFCWLLWRRID